MSGTGGPRPGSGRPKGSKGILGLEIKTALLEAFNHKDVGGVKWLVSLAKTDKKTFAALLSKAMPTEIKGEVQVNHIQTILAELGGRTAEDHEEDKPTLQ